MDLNKIIQHPLFPFSDFRTNDASFLMLELYWGAVAREALGEEVSAHVVPLQSTDRDAENWGDPLMIDFWVPSQRRGAKVTLLENTEGLPACRDATDKLNCFPSIVTYVSRRGVSGPDDEIDQICFRADMSDIARSVITELLHAFLVKGVNSDQIEPWFDEFNVRTGEGPSLEKLQSLYTAPEDEDNE